MNKIDAVLFDYGMVLSAAPDLSAWARMREVSGLTEDILHHRYWADRHAYDRGDLKAEQFWSRVIAEQAPLSPETFVALTAADVDFWGGLNQPMIDWADTLKRSGLRIGILSNMPDAMEVGLRARHSWIENFDHQTWSHVVNLAKPEPAIYQHAIDGFGVPAERILFLDDRMENINAARALGMQAIQYACTEHEEFAKRMHAAGLGYLLQLQGDTVSQNGKV